MLQTINDWRRLQYETEKSYAQKILAAPKGSAERERLLTAAYDEVNKIMAKYYPAGNVTADNTKFLALLVQKNFSPQSKILDLGCGSGELLYSLAKAGYKVTGLDVSPVSIKRAQERLAELNLENNASVGDITSLKTTKKFDCLIMDNVIEHLAPDTTIDILKKCREVLTDNGQIIIATPHQFSGPHDVSKFFLPLGAKAEGLHLREYTFTDLDKVLRAAGFSQTLGFCHHPRLFSTLGLVPLPSAKNAIKDIKRERYFAGSKLLTLNRQLSKIIVALCFPAVIVGKK